MSLLLLLSDGNSLAQYNLTLVDATGVNPLPANIVYLITRNDTGKIAASGYVPIGAVLSVSLVEGLGHTITFTGTQAPNSATVFTTTVATSPVAQTITVQNFLSATPSLVGLAAQQTQLWPRDWFGDTAKASGGNAYALAYSNAYALNQLGIQSQTTQQILRLQSAVGNDIDSFAKDYFGNTLLRLQGELDSFYRARIIANLSAEKGTRAGLLLVAQSYGQAWIDEPWLAGEVGAFDVHGTLVWDGVGGAGNYGPLILLFIIPFQPLTASQQAQMKSNLMGCRPAGVPMTIYTVSGNVGTQI